MTDRCPHCGENLAYKVGSRTFSRAISHEHQGVYDGVLYWSCPFCGGHWHRFPPGDSRHGRAARFIGEPQVPPTLRPSA